MLESTPIPGAGNGSQTDHKRNNNAIQTRKPSQYLARSARKSNCINFLESNFPDSLYLDELISASSCICKPCHLKNISDTFTSMPDVKSAEKLLHEREVDQSLNALVQLLHSQS